MTSEDLVSTFKKHPVTLICGVLSLGLAIGIYVRAGDIPAANQRLDEKTAEARRCALNITNGAQLKEQLDAMIAANQAVEARLIRASDLGINQQFFYKLESESGVKLTDLRQGRLGAVKGSYGPVTFTVSLDGSYPQVLAFVQALESRAHYCRILTASLVGSRAGAGVSLSLNLELLGRP
ncbi:hypothetical protein [Opitutus sp. ER46]|uniref:hypothetical protein n=1 Tax=Opitutus sp. ER46 TaxID=2161864 RepID=UPI000D32001D|nr:hypothetical protein [Opitutus sp. ER46]PTX91734.1 hypothetical protein DB354_17895 [Opitutus sp. ER46]